ncbi:MAG: S46 family peptidase [Acidimicrobiia bacterium]|nr:S46 family peptidase [Acidimicrobiia bacterium]
MIKRQAVIAIGACAVLIVSTLQADEGMWTFDNPPRQQWRERYQFEPSNAWLDHLRLSSIRLIDGGSGGGSASFVSPNGLILTNQHVAAGQLQKLSTATRDLVRDGYYAATRDAELKCPDLEANVLVSFEDVTRRVQDAVEPGASDAAAAAARRSTIATIEKESFDKTGLRSDVVTLYSGGEYWLYRYKKYTDIRLVFAPEEQIAYFGGDYDNFVFPRHDLDIAFLRAYENGRPARTERFLRWSEKGATDGEFIVLSGLPGSTDRLLTMTQITYQRDIGNPLQCRVWESRRHTLAAYGQSNAEAARQAAGTIRSLENSLKRLVGQQQGLENPRILARKAEEDKALRAKVAADATWQQQYASAWDRIDELYRDVPARATRLAFSTLSPSRLGGYATTLVRYEQEIKKASDTRLEEFRDSRLDALKFALFSTAPVYPAMEEAILTGWLEEARRALGPDDPFVKAALHGREPGQVAREAIVGTGLADVATRKTMLERGVATSSDPLIVLARRIDPIARELRDWQDSTLRSVEASAGQQIAAARFAAYGKSVYPDATFTLRLGYGRVLGYEEDTTLVPWKTTFYGLFDRAESFGEKPPFDLPARWKAKRDRLALATPLNFAYTGDTIGGNSGSPIVNRAGELIGLNFDSNQQKLPNRYVYIDESEGSRAIAVHSAAILEALTKMYDAKELVQEVAPGR